MMMVIKSVVFLILFVFTNSRNVFGQELFQTNNYIVHHEIKQALDITNLTTNCQKHLWMANENLDQLWALKMLDASSKLPTGILSGHIADLGAFDQCLAIEHNIGYTSIKGNYCKVTVPFSNFKMLIPLIKKNDHIENRGIINLATGELSLWLSICVPSSCTAHELNDILKESVEANQTNTLNINVNNCQSHDNVIPFGVVDYCAATFFSFILAILFLSTAYDCYIQYKEKKPAHLILIAFSVYSNGKKLLTVTKNSNQLTCLHGVRCISMMWVIIGHTYFTAIFSPSINGADALPWMKQWTSMYVLGATVSVDTFFLLGGILMSYIYLIAKEKGIKFNIIMYYIHRYIRLTPALAVAIILHVSLLRYFGSGPYWPEVLANLADNCSTYWWSSLLYIQNYVNPGKMCINQTWYLSVDMQLFILSPFALIPLGIWPGRTIIGLGVCIILSIISPFVVSYEYELRGLMSEAAQNPNFGSQYYMNTYTRFGPVLVGIVLGYYIYTKKENHKINTLFKNIIYKYTGWVLAFTCMLLIVFGANNMYFHDYNKWESSFYLALHRVVWSIALSWIIYASVIGHGGIINSFLSLHVFQILSRITYSMYLLHLSFQTMKIGLLRVPINFGNFENMYNFWGDFCITAVMATCWTLAFESPMIIIEKFMFRNLEKPKKRPPLNAVITEKY